MKKVLSIINYQRMLIQKFKNVLPAIKHQRFSRKQFKNVNKKIINKDNVKVGIIAQMPEVWDKLELIYEEMINRDNFNVSLIVVPEYDFVRKQVKNTYGKELAFFKTVSDNCILAFSDNGWIDLKEFNYDFIFYQRPYDWYLPQKLQSDYVSKFSKRCYVPYAEFQGNDFSLSLPFFYNVSYAFMYSKEACDILRSKSRRRLLSKYQFFYDAYPIYEKYQNMNNEKNNSKVKILWTPRWVTDEASYECHFFDYKDRILDLNIKFENLEVVFRPHPLAFDNYISTGQMTREEVNDYKNKLKQKNVFLDENAIIEDTFRDTDILISDISSIVTLFYLTGKPVIFCASKRTMNDTFKQIVDSLYYATSWQEVESYLTEIINNNDYMYQKRIDLRNKLFNKQNNVAKYIVDILCK